jgi:hypothetical protein
MTTAQHTVSRFHLLDRPVAAPASCVVCGGYNNAVVDFNANVRGYGALYFCVDCLAEAGRVIGLIPAGEIATEKQYAERFIDSYLNDNDLVVIPRDFFDTASDAVNSLSDGLASAILHIPVEAASDVSDDTTEAAGDSSASDSKSGSGAEGNSGQSAGTNRRKRSNRVSNDPSDELFGESL